MSHFIHLDYKQFVKISHETIAPWPLFLHTFIAGADGNRISHQYLILGISKTCSEELNSYFNGVVKIPKICTNSKRIFQNLSAKNSDKTSFHPKVTLSIQDS